MPHLANLIANRHDVENLAKNLAKTVELNQFRRQMRQFSNAYLKNVLKNDKPNMRQHHKAIYGELVRRHHAEIR